MSSFSLQAVKAHIPSKLRTDEIILPIMRDHVSFTSLSLHVCISSCHRFLEPYSVLIHRRLLKTGDIRFWNISHSNLKVDQSICIHNLEHKEESQKRNATCSMDIILIMCNSSFCSWDGNPYPVRLQTRVNMKFRFLLPIQSIGYIAEQYPSNFYLPFGTISV